MEILKYRTAPDQPWIEMVGLVGPKGDKGDQGKDGYTPVKGVDYYTNAEKQALIDEVRGAVSSGGLNRVIVETLPTENIDDQTIYMILKVEAFLNDYYDEYMYINNAWELIGSTRADLSDYYTKSEVDELIPSTGDFMDLSNAQTVNGDKTFAKTIVVGSGTTTGQYSNSGITFKSASYEDKTLTTTATGLAFRWKKITSESSPASFTPYASSWYNLGSDKNKWGTLFCQKLSDGTTTKTMAEVLSGQDLTAYATKEYVDQALAAIIDGNEVSY